MAGYKSEIITMVHEGPVFPEEYVPVGYTYNGKVLPPLAEEMFVGWAKYSRSDYASDKVLVKNVGKCILRELPADQKANFPDDYQNLVNQILSDLDAAKIAKASRPEAEVAAEKREKDAIKAKHIVAIKNGKVQPLGGYMIEAPGFILTRGKSPIKGLWKYRTVPEDVVINFIPLPKEEWDKLPTDMQNVILGKADISTLSAADQKFIIDMNLPQAPKAPAGHKWKDVIANYDGNYTFKYKVDVGHHCFRDKQIRFGANSDDAANADELKYDNAVKLLKKLKTLNNHIKKGMQSTNKKTAQAALVTYLIMNTAIRVGNEKSEDEADTVGMSTMKVGNIKLHIED